MLWAQFGGGDAEPQSRADGFQSRGWEPERGAMAQIRTGSQPGTQITVGEAESGKQNEAFSLMSERARFMARQPGFVSISLHKSLDGRRIVNYVQWQSPDLLRAAHKSPEFRKEWK